MIVAYRLLDRGIDEKYWSMIILPGFAALLYLSQATGAWQVYLLMLGAVWLLELGYLQVRYQYGHALVQSLPLNEIRTGDVPRRPVHTENGELLCEAGEPFSAAQARRLRELGREGGLPSVSALELEQAFPFVPFIVAGAMLSALFAGNLVPPLTTLVVWLTGG